MTRFPKPTDRPSLNLVATVGSRLSDDPVDRLERPADLAAWLAAEGHADLVVDDAALVDARALREAIHPLLVAAWAGAPPPEAAVAAVNASATAHAPRLRWDGTGFTVERSDGVGAALSAIAADAVRLLSGPDASRLHQCESEPCATFFLAPTSARPRRWCSPDVCGNRARVAAHRRRSHPTTPGG
ncbi:CGNR zinc finger domain-containing protein [Pseudonocardia sp. GCM10023141]|uniref:CGNR zinc finger domain-containing protein n=1 Tax=Pseudonocardia sp. GCM10023141 TaxID=3252653 RepID=UPI003608D30E